MIKTGQVNQFYNKPVLHFGYKARWLANGNGIGKANMIGNV